MDIIVGCRKRDASTVGIKMSKNHKDMTGTMSDLRGIHGLAYKMAAPVAGGTHELFSFSSFFSLILVNQQIQYFNFYWQRNVQRALKRR